MKWLFWISLALVAYTYVGYPLVLWVLTRLAPRDARKGPFEPTVTIIIAARNEADKIRRKIEHTLALQYPADRFDVLVASDASDDGTDEIVNEYAGRGVRLVRARQRKGKENAQGLALGVATGEIIVMTDSATLLEPEALRHLVANFADPAIGAVSSEDVLVDAAGNPTAEGVYVKFEMWVRRLESRFHSIVGLSGSCFAIRRELCGQWPAHLASDFLSALHAARAGYRAVTDPSARGRFVAVASKAEMPRKVRTFLRGITVLMASLDLLNPFRYGRFAFQLASHKLLRFLAPILLVVAFVTGALVSLLSDDLLVRLAFGAQVAFYLAAYLSGVFPSWQHRSLIRVAHFFTMVQVAMLMAWGKYAMGQQQVTWEPSRRPVITPGVPPSS
jgi:cellulose synthase/poly-beta-1,6-N-acetylglucosamine synthase-like glycosyltransferase